MDRFCLICGLNKLIGVEELEQGICDECNTEINIVKQRKLTSKVSSTAGSQSLRKTSLQQKAQKAVLPHQCD
ncbi:hypothetical protein SY88_12915 [Clostridiales bacterium PH28_bin88]|nr:hypothetical protein SY88_12915 [Clostridiales bacterium PH28_bin88]